MFGMRTYALSDFMYAQVVVTFGVAFCMYTFCVPAGYAVAREFLVIATQAVQSRIVLPTSDIPVRVSADDREDQLQKIMLHMYSHPQAGKPLKHSSMSMVSYPHARKPREIH